MHKSTLCGVTQEVPALYGPSRTHSCNDISIMPCHSFIQEHQLVLQGTKSFKRANLETEEVLAGLYGIPDKPRLNQPPRYYLFCSHKPFSNMNNCLLNQQRPSHLAEITCSMIPGNLFTKGAELALIIAQARKQTWCVQHKHSCSKAKLPCTVQTTSPDRRRELSKALSTGETRKAEL